MSTKITDVSKEFKPGNKVHYVASHLKNQPLNRYNVENGIVKQVTGAGVFVVYHCDDKWSEYENYTAACTDPEDLKHGWVE